MSNTGKKKKVYKEIECDSDEEVYFLMWCFELKEAGYITKVERSPSFVLTDGWQHSYEEVLKTKRKPKVQTLLRPSEYTPDVLITFAEDKWDKLVWLKTSEKFDKLFIGTNDARVFMSSGYDNGNKGYPHTQVLVEVKSNFNYQNMSRLFTTNQKFLYEKFKIYVNLVKIPDFFKHTFYPKSYLKTSRGKDRKVKSEVRTVEEYLKTLESK